MCSNTSKCRKNVAVDCKGIEEQHAFFKEIKLKQINNPLLHSRIIPRSKW